jgi:hypothetical protein
VTRAGVWTLLSLVLQILLDSTHLSVALMWVARSSAPASALAFGLAFSVAFGALLYFGVDLLLVALLIAGIGLLRGTRVDARFN